jgi:hypothetical protein
VNRLFEGSGNTHHQASTVIMTENYSKGKLEAHDPLYQR